jgi:hypothetical protein
VTASPTFTLTELTGQLVDGLFADDEEEEDDELPAITGSRPKARP